MSRRPAVRRRSRTFLRIAAFALVVLAFDQALQLTLLRDGDLFGRRVAPYDPPLFSPSQRATVQRIREHVASRALLEGAFDFDAELGWCPRHDGGAGEFRYDWAGARIADAPLARAKRNGTKRIVAMGDSFVLGIEVGARESWCAELARELPNVEVANLGVGSYGTDQAFLRWRRDGRPLAGDEVWLGILPSVASRVATVYLPAMRHWSPSVAFKPRFMLDEHGELVLAASPAPTLERLLELVSSQREFLAALGDRDVWVRRTPSAWAPMGSSLLHRFACSRLLLTLAEHGGRAPEPWLEDQGGEVFRVTTAVVVAMKREVEAQRARFRVLVFPDRDGLSELASNGHAYWRALEDELERHEVEIVDFTRALEAVGGTANDALWAPEGHYSAAGNAAVARELARVCASSH